MFVLLVLLSAFLQSIKDAMAKSLAIKMDIYTFIFGISLGMILINLTFLLGSEFNNFNLNINFWIYLVAY